MKPSTGHPALRSRLRDWSERRSLDDALSAPISRISVRVNAAIGMSQPCILAVFSAHER